jgi:EmrB/QacA subfamily drug resistance transporter
MIKTSFARMPGRSRAARRPSGHNAAVGNPWHALWAMMVGFFMILVDATIVAVANPSIMDGLDASYDAVIWVTSSYLLSYAVPLLLAGRLGDRFGPKNLYLIGLAVFTAASLWCGLSGSIGMLIAARLVQGIGAALLTPQTLSTITRIFPAQHRGVAMSVWGATAGVATLVGPLAGGVLVDGLGWEWIFIVNVPIGIVGLVLAHRLVPVLPTAKPRFDVLGVVLSGAGMLVIVFALQEGQSHDWALWIWGLLAVGVALMAGFVYWQTINPNEPLIPLQIFRDRDFLLSNLGVATIGFVVTGMMLPVMFYAQAVCGLGPTEAALLTAPMAVASGVLAPVVGRLVDRMHPRPIIGFGFSALAIALTWLSFEMTPTTPIWRLVLPFVVMGLGMAFIWTPLATTGTRHLAPDLAGAGSGVYNATRQVGSVLGSASMAAFMTSRIGAEMPAGQGQAPPSDIDVTRLPGFLHAPFAAAMSQSLLLSAFIALFGIVAALFLLGFGRPPRGAEGRRASARTGPMAREEARYRHPADDDHYDEDDDHYLEYTVSWDEPEPPRRSALPVPSRVPVAVDADEGDTEPLASRPEHLLPAPAETWHSDPVESWHSLFDDAPAAPPPVRDAEDQWGSIVDDFLTDTLKPQTEPIGHGHNGFHLDHEQRFQPQPRRRAAEEGWTSPNGRHSRVDPDDDSPRGRHSRD